MPGRTIPILTTGLVLFVAASTALGLGMRVQPGGALIQGWPVGEKRELPVPFVVFNDDDKPRTVTLDAVKPSAVGGSTARGYSEIPDPAWLTFEKNEATVPPREHITVKMFLSVPDEARYRNGHWSVSIAARGKAGPKERIGLALFPRFEIETAASENDAAPVGVLAVTPSFFSIEDVVPDEKPRTRAFFVWNNSERPRRCAARILVRPAEGEKPLVPLSHGTTWIPSANWVSVKTPAFDVPANGKALVSVEVALPVGAGENGVWEAVLLVTSEDDLTAFARIRVATPKVER